MPYYCGVCNYTLTDNNRVYEHLMSPRHNNRLINLSDKESIFLIIINLKTMRRQYKEKTGVRLDRIIQKLNEDIRLMLNKYFE